MQIIVLGAGAIGSVYGAKLSKFHDVTLIGGQSHVDAIQRDGLVMHGNTTGTLRLPAFTEVPRIEPGTLILLTTKVNNNAAAVAPIVNKLSNDVTIVCVQNGLYSENIVKDLVGDRALVLRAITQVGGVLVRPGVVDNTVVGGQSNITHLVHAMAAVEAGLCEVALVTYGSTQHLDKSRARGGRLSGRGAGVGAAGDRRLAGPGQIAQPLGRRGDLGRSRARAHKGREQDAGQEQDRAQETASGE